ncbi:MAG: Tad domain-containing protein [Micromonosporaceae bacterium]|nr:Tad domain-containing protein [Micromonosporaceae bacterium]
MYAVARWRADRNHARWRADQDRSRDRGAVAVVVAVVVASGVLLGLGALVVDIGAMHAEREQLQTGADAAAVKIAQECAADLSQCTSTAGLALAEAYADDNANDGAAGVTVVCGRGGSLPECPPPPSQVLTDCVNPAPVDIDYVEVRLHTALPSGSTVLPPAFAGAVVDGYHGSTMAACARAGWGPPASAGLSATISYCEWSGYTQGGTSFPEPPAERTIYLHTNAKAGKCYSTPAGGDTPGGFGWLADPTDECMTPVAADGTYLGDPGADVPKGCAGHGHEAGRLEELYEAGQPVLMPVYERVTGSGASTRYTIYGFAAFILTGWNLPNVNPSVGPAEPTTTECKGNDFCLYGYFTEALIPTTGAIGGPDLGSTIVSLIG